MKNVSSLKINSADSPKTPGGISRSLLTPCRRVGLSRKFRKSGPSPFQSPLSSHTEVKQVKAETRKRKGSVEETPQTPENVGDSENPEVVQTPTRNIEMPRRKKSKTLITSMNKTIEENEHQIPTEINVPVVDKCTVAFVKDKDDFVHNTTLSTPVRTKSLRVKSKSKKKISPLKESTVISTEKENLNNYKTSITIEDTKETIDNQEETKEKSPNNLTKECIVVIQKKIFKKELNEKLKIQKSECYKQKVKEIASQAIFDSDSDDVPLKCLNNKDITKKPVVIESVDEEDDFSIGKTLKSDHIKSSKTKSTKSPISNKNKNTSKANLQETPKLTHSQSSVDDDDDDDFFEKKRTILIRKNYEKVMKPQKAKSTGSITQKDIDDLKSRIETKKKMLLARSMKEDTKELRDLIKKWQKGCQDALMELMDLMKSKFPDKQNMDYSEMLQTLKIPASLVGYDSDNDCFLTPDDASIILANVKD